MAKFLGNIKKREDLLREKERVSGEKQNFYYVVRGAIWDTFGKDFIETAIYCFFSESCAVGFTSFLIVLIAFIKDPEASTGEGIGYLAIFAAMMISASLFRNYYIFHGYVVAVNIRKTIITALYTKLARLSMKSLTETNSGKLVTIVSGDI